MEHPKQPEAFPASSIGREPYEFEPEAAEDFAEWMNEQAVADADEGESPWTFEAAHDDSYGETTEGSGKSWVVLYDDQGAFVGYWTFDPGNYRKPPKEPPSLPVG